MTAEIYTAFDIARVVLMFVTLAVAATTDTLHFRIHNSLTYSAAAIGLALGFGMGGLGFDRPITEHTLLGHLAAMGIGFGIFFVAWWAKGVAGGEVKLAAALGALAGFPFVVHAIFWSTLVGFVMAIWMLVFKGDLNNTLRRAVWFAVSLKTPPESDPAATKIPFGVAMAFGSMWAFILLQTGSPA